MNTEQESSEQESKEQSFLPSPSRASKVDKPLRETSAPMDGQTEELIERWESETGARLSRSQRRMISEWVSRYGIERVTQAADEALVAEMHSSKPSSRFRYWRRAAETPWTRGRAGNPENGVANAAAYTSSPSADMVARWKAAFPDIYD